MLAYLGRYTHRVAISNQRLITLDETGVTFRCKDYRRAGAERYGTMTLAPAEFIRRFLLHVLPRGFHRIRHYGLLAASARRSVFALVRELLAVPPPDPAKPIDTPEPAPCPCCGGRMRLVGTITREALIQGTSRRDAWARGRQPRGPPPPPGQAGETGA